MMRAPDRAQRAPRRGAAELRQAAVALDVLAQEQRRAAAAWVSDTAWVDHSPSSGPACAKVNSPSSAAQMDVSRRV
jgi:hypothetical protein